MPITSRIVISEESLEQAHRERKFINDNIRELARKYPSKYAITKLKAEEAEDDEEET